MLDLIASLVVRGLNRVFHIMPISFNLWLGRRFGSLIHVLSKKRSRIAYANLKASFYGEKTPEELKRIVRGVYKNMAQTFMEILSLTKVDKDYIEKYVVIENFDRIVDAASNPKGMLLLSAHFGNWELSTVASVTKGFLLYLLARDQKMKNLNELLNELRESRGNIVIRKGTDIKSIFKVLRQGKSVGILGDQNAGPTGELVDFFGRPASCASGPFRFAQKSGSCILPAFIHRENGPYHRLVLEPKMVINKGDDLRPFILEYNKLLEAQIRKHPEQWLWMHKRWKMTPLKKIMVLDDGKKGHLKQSLAVVDLIKEYRIDEGFAPENLKVDIVKISFKNKAAKLFLNTLSPFFSNGAQGHLNALKRAITEESYKEAAVNRYADVIVSCGSSLFAVNKLLKIENNARNVAVLDPGLLNRKSFDLVVIPRHDCNKNDLSAYKNIVITDLAPNRSNQNLAEGGNSEQGNVREKPLLGVLIGGDNKFFGLDDELSKVLVRNINITAEKFNADIYLTTSRRTPRSAEEIFKKGIKYERSCFKFVSGREDGDPRTVEKILSKSNLILVSGESISMVSEAVSSGNPVLVFMPNKTTNGETKYERFVQGLDEKGYIRLITPDKLGHEAESVLSGKSKPVIPDDNDRIYRNLYRLF